MTSRNCIHCKRPIEPDARKCAECLSWQSKWFGDPRSPRLQLLTLGLVLLLAAPLMALLIFDTQRRVSRQEVHRFGGDRPPLVVRDTALHFVDLEAGPHLIVVGHLENVSPEVWTDVVLHAEFFDAAGELIDVVAKEEWGLAVAPRSRSSFRLLAPAGAEPESYASHTVEVRWATRR